MISHNGFGMVTKEFQADLVMPQSPVDMITLPCIVDMRDTVEHTRLLEERPGTYLLL